MLLSWFRKVNQKRLTTWTLIYELSTASYYCVFRNAPESSTYLAKVLMSALELSITHMNLLLK